MRTDIVTDDINVVLDALLNPSGEPKIFKLSLSAFKDLYQRLQGQKQGTVVDILLNGKWAFIQFSQLCNHRIRILPDNKFRTIPRFLGIRQYLEEKDFEIASINARFFGQRRYLTIGRFFLEEIETDGWLGLTIFILTGLLLSWLTNSSGKVDAIKTANDLLIGISSIFFSIFMLFTVSQNLPSIANLYLFKSGLTHRFIGIDRLISWISVLALGIALGNRVVVESEWVFNIQLVASRPGLIGRNEILPWSTAIAMSLIFSSLFIVVRYYLKRVEYLLERELSKQLLDELANQERLKETP
jgi:hypothetical protein